MAIFLDTRGNSNYGIGICDRCRKKFPIEQLQEDRNTPGLRVCEADNDDYDPWRLPAISTDDITLPFYRPDESIAIEAEAEGIDGDLRITEVEEDYRLTQSDDDVDADEYRTTEVYP